MLMPLFALCIALHRVLHASPTTRLQAIRDIGFGKMWRRGGKSRRPLARAPSHPVKLMMLTDI